MKTSISAYILQFLFLAKIKKNKKKDLPIEKIKLY